MSDTNPSREDELFQHRALESAIRIGLILLLVVWCFNIVKPFLMLILWGAIIAVAVYPLFMKLQSLLGGRQKLASTLMTLIALAMLITPTIMLSDSAIKNSQAFAKKLQEGTLTIPPPSEKLRNWPLIGEDLHDAWSLAATNLEVWVKKYSEQLTALGKFALSAAAGAGVGRREGVGGDGPKRAGDYRAGRPHAQDRYPGVPPPLSTEASPIGHQAMTGRPARRSR